MDSESIIQIMSRGVDDVDFFLSVASQRLARHRKVVGVFDPDILDRHDRTERSRIGR